MASLYDEVCLRAFPDDDAVVSLLKARGAREMSAEDVKVTMNDDPARGWTLPGEFTTVWLEFPPYHACSVRWNSSQMPNTQAYVALRDAFAKGHARSGSITEQTFEKDLQQLHIKASVTAFQPKSDEGGDGAQAESLLLITQSINNPGRRAIGETGYVVRMVHQRYSPAATTGD
ncbi:hypothetical protein WBP06_12545 [Novosphingobium sp. BL-8H]|uniref:NMCC_0638 family (lipo)protein n=1 Tax=Novosphingobium sp. BL-8H TaxID=3127640 RepID=UPI00375719D0